MIFLDSLHSGNPNHSAQCDHSGNGTTWHTAVSLCESHHLIINLIINLFISKHLHIFSNNTKVACLYIYISKTTSLLSIHLSWIGHIQHADHCTCLHDHMLIFCIFVYKKRVKNIACDHANRCNDLHVSCSI